MGVFTWTLGQVAITAITLGALKRRNIIELQPQNVKNDSLRMVFVQAITLGEEVNIMAEKLISSVQEEMNSSKRR